MTVEPKAIGIVVVDDEPSITKAIRMLLRREGYTVQEFNNPFLAIEKIQDLNVQVVISDMRMPDMDGAQLLKKVKEIKPNARRVLLTGFSDTEASVRAINEGGVHVFLNKPWSNEDLRAVILEQITEYSKRVRVKAVARKAKEYAKRAEYFKEKMNEALDEGRFAQSEKELRVFTNIFNSFLRQLNEELAIRQEKAIGLSKLLCEHYQLPLMRRRLVGYACRFFPINVITGRKGTAMDPFLFETLPLRFNGHLALERTAHILQLSLERPSRQGPLGLVIEEVPIDAQIVSISIWVSRYLKEMLPYATIERYLLDQKGDLFSEQLIQDTLRLLPELPDQLETDLSALNVLKEGQELAEDVRDGESRLLLARGTIMNDGLIEALKQYEWHSEEIPEIKVVSDAARVK